MEIQGTVKQLLAEQSGSGKNGTWRKQEFILETEGQYPKTVCIVMWGEKIDEFKLTIGEKVNVSINIESREFNGRWYTDVKAWKIDKNAGATGNSNASTTPADGNANDDASGLSFSENEDEFPF